MGTHVLATRCFACWQFSSLSEFPCNHSKHSLHMLQHCVAYVWSMLQKLLMPLKQQRPFPYGRNVFMQGVGCLETIEFSSLPHQVWNVPSAQRQISSAGAGVVTWHIPACP